MVCRVRERRRRRPLPSEPYGKVATLLEVVEAVGGPLRGVARPVGKEGAALGRRLQAVCQAVAAVVRERLAAVTLAELAKGGNDRRARGSPPTSQYGRRAGALSIHVTGGERQPASEPSEPQRHRCRPALFGYPDSSPR
jgi:hypothetical protein